MGTDNAIRVVYAEDQIGMRRAVCNYLNSNYLIEVVYDTDNGEALLSYLTQNLPHPDICILDISMPKMDGLTTLKLIEKKWPKLKCIIYSMHYSEQTISKAIYHGAKAYLSKPKHDYAQLLQAVIAVNKSGIAYTIDADQEMFQRVTSRSIEVPTFSEKERLFIQLLCEGLSYPEIGLRMEVSMKTIEGYRTRIFKKLKVRNKVGVALEALKFGIINIP